MVVIKCNRYFEVLLNRRKYQIKRGRGGEGRGVVDVRLLLEKVTRAK